MRSVRNSLMLFLSIAALAAGDDVPIRPKPADSYPNHQTISGLTIAAEVYTTRQQTESAFGKLDPNQYGVLPVLVVMRNGAGEVLNLEKLRVEYIRPDRRHLPNIPPSEVKYLNAPSRPKMGPSMPNPIPGLGKKGKKNPLAAFEIESRAFAARMLTPEDSASGFFYFQTANHRGAILYLTGITKAASGAELFFFEIPLD